MPRNRDWQNQAACKGHPIEWWFPEVELSDRTRTPYAQAKLICTPCPVRTQCLKDALQDETYQRWRFGMYGGLTPWERVEIANKNK